MDREISMKLFEATTDDDGKVADTVSKPICKAAIKAKEPALLDMAKWLVDRLQNNESSRVKIKVLRIVMQMIASPKAARFGELFKEHGHTTLGHGKMYHPGLPPQNDEGKSWPDDHPSSPSALVA